MESFNKLSNNKKFIVINFVVSFFAWGFSEGFDEYVDYFFWSLQGVVFLWFIIAFFTYPIFYVVTDKRIDRETKVGWLILTLFFSWITFAFYLIKNKK